MIQFRVSLVLCVRDAFTGKAVVRNAVRCQLDGSPYVPQYKEGGYFVFVDLPAGEHTVMLLGAYYQNEILEVTTTHDSMQEQMVKLKPAANYPFERGVVRLSGTLENKGKAIQAGHIYIAPQYAATEIKIAQDQAEVGATEMRVYFRGRGERIAVPSEYLIVDGKNSEIVLLKEINDETGVLGAPLQYTHKRGKAVYGVTQYLADDKGRFLAFLPEAVRVTVFCAQYRYIEDFDLGEKDNEITVNVQ